MVKFNPDEDNKCCWRFWGCSLNNGLLYCWTVPILVSSAVILFIVLLAVSIKDVDENEMAIPYGKISRHVGSVVDAGKRAYPPDTHLFIYDRKFITNELEIPCISKDGLVITLRVVQQYRLLKEELKSVLFDFGEQRKLDDYIDTIAQDTIRDACAAFNGEEFFSRRGDVENFIITNMTVVTREADAHVEPGFIQLKNIALPRTFLNAIQSKQLALEDVDVANNERAQTLIQAETRRQQADLDAQIVIVNANAAGDVIKLAAQERANARLIQWAERAKAFIIDLEALNIDPITYVDNYLFVRLRSQTLTPVQQSCLRICEANPPASSCWFCFTTATPSVSV